MSKSKKVDEVLKVIVDNRERALIDHIRETRGSSIDLEVKQLDVADIVCSERLGIERKEGFDFVISITDNRLFEQLERLEKTYEYPVLLIEELNENVFKNVSVKKNSIYGALAYICYKRKTSVIHTLNLEDTVVAIERFAYREQVKDEMPVLARRAPKTMTLEERRKFVIEGLFNCGPKKAEMLIDVFKTPEGVINAIKDTEIVYTRNGKPKGIIGPIKLVENLSWKFVERNKELLLGQGFELINESQKKPVQMKL